MGPGGRVGELPSSSTFLPTQHTQLDKGGGCAQLAHRRSIVVELRYEFWTSDGKKCLSESTCKSATNPWAVILLFFVLVRDRSDMSVAISCLFLVWWVILISMSISCLFVTWVISPSIRALLVHCLFYFLPIATSGKSADSVNSYQVISKIMCMQQTFASLVFCF